MTKTDRFWDWAEDELEKRGLTWHRVETIAGISNATVSRRARERLPPTDTTYSAISQAFHIPMADVLKYGGKLPGEPSDPATREALFLFENLSHADKQKLLIMMRCLYEHHETGGD